MIADLLRRRKCCRQLPLLHPGDLRYLRKERFRCANLSDWLASIGLGLFAIRPIKRGAYIATHRGRRVTEEADRRDARGARHLSSRSTLRAIDGSPRWNVARYINHSCKPNARPAGRNGGIVIVADRRIESGEEITYSPRGVSPYFVENGGCHCAACIRKRMLRRRRARQASPAHQVRV